MDRLGQDVHNPMYDPLAKSEIISGEEGIPNEDSDGGEDNDTEETEDKAPDG